MSDLCTCHNCGSKHVTEEDAAETRRKAFAEALQKLRDDVEESNEKLEDWAPMCDFVEWIK